MSELIKKDTTYSDLPTDQKAEVRRLVDLVLKAISPNDSTGHLPNCGYTNETPICGCGSMGNRLFNSLAKFVSGSTRTPVMHRYVHIENNGGTCSCGSYISWFGQPKSPGMCLAEHIINYQKEG